MPFLLGYNLKEILGLGDGFVGAGAFAGAAVDAFVGIDGVGGVAGYDGTHRAYIGAGTASYAQIGIDFSRHNSLSLNCCCVFQSAKIGIIFDFEKNCH